MRIGIGVGVDVIVVGAGVRLGGGSSGLCLCHREEGRGRYTSQHILAGVVTGIVKEISKKNIHWGFLSSSFIFHPTKYEQDRVIEIIMTYQRGSIYRYIDGLCGGGLRSHHPLVGFRYGMSID